MIMKQIESSHADTGAHVRTRLYVLIACEESQAECRAFRELGHIAFSCDVQPCIKTGNPAWHIQGDVTPLLQGGVQFTTQNGVQMKVPKWDLIIAHPPCTYLCKVSSIHLINRKAMEAPSHEWIWSQSMDAWLNLNRWDKLKKARAFFYLCLNAQAKYVAVENPLPMAISGLPKPSCFACPSWFGVKYTKKTLYWLRNLPPIVASCEYPNPKEYVRSSRGKYRSRTFPQLAQAIALQWSSYILDELAQTE